MTGRRIVAAVCLIVVALALAIITAVAYLDDSDWPLGPKDGAR